MFIVGKIKSVRSRFFAASLVVPSAARNWFVESSVGHTLIGGKNHCVAPLNVMRHGVAALKDLKVNNHFQ